MKIRIPLYLLSLVTFVAVIPFGLSLQAAPDSSKPIPSPEKMQALVWRASKLHDFIMEGNVEVHPHKGKKQFHAMTLRTKDRLMQLEFKKNPLQIQVQLTPAGSIVKTRNGSSGTWKELKGAERLKKILGSDLTYEDLGLEFLRWPTARPLGADTIIAFPTWTYEASPPAMSNYSKAIYWISARHLAVLRVDAFDKSKRLHKRVEILGVKKVEKAWTIDQMVVKTMRPGKEISLSKTYIVIKKAKGGSGL